jgi:D-glycero-D-manno-heptose 1,7-bisphosphate phosphatase
MEQTSNAAPLRPAAFIDRDGVINRELDYVHRPEDFHLLQGAITGLQHLQAAGYALVVVTNQAGIARGLYSEADYEHLTRYMRALLREHGVELAGVYHCPHHPTAGIGAYRVDCTCRKPQPGMLLDAARDLGLSLPHSVLVGDKASDVEAGRRAGVRHCVLVSSGHALSAVDRSAADGCFSGLEDAASWLVAQAQQT